MEDSLILQRDTIEIEGGRKLYNYTFHGATDQDRLLSMIEAGERGVIARFIDDHPGLDLAAALEAAKGKGHEEAVAEIAKRS